MRKSQKPIILIIITTTTTKEKSNKMYLRAKEPLDLTLKLLLCRFNSNSIQFQTNPFSNNHNQNFYYSAFAWVFHYVARIHWMWQWMVACLSLLQTGRFLDIVVILCFPPFLFFMIMACVCCCCYSIVFCSYLGTLTLSIYETKMLVCV